MTTRNDKTPIYEVSPDREAGGGLITAATEHIPGFVVSAMQNGWIKMSRDIIDHWVFRNPNHLKMWVYLLMRASYKPAYQMLVKGSFVTIERGDVLTSLDRIAIDCHVTKKQVRTFLKLAQECSMIVPKLGTKTAHLSICNYDTYQEVGHEKGTTRAREGHDKGTIQEGKNTRSKKEEVMKKTSLPALSPTGLRADVPALPTNTGDAFPILQDDVDRWSELYPAVDVLQELRKMVGWLDANPSRRKTARGMRAFIANWLSKQQDRGNGQQQAAKRTTGDRAMAGSDPVEYIASVAGDRQQYQQLALPGNVARGTLVAAEIRAKD